MGEGKRRATSVAELFRKKAISPRPGKSGLALFRKSQRRKRGGEGKHPSDGDEHERGRGLFF